MPAGERGGRDPPSATSLGFLLSSRGNSEQFRLEAPLPTGKRVLRLRFATLRTNGGNLASRTPHLVIPADIHSVIPADAHPRHSRESGNPSILVITPCLSILPTQPHAPCITGCHGVGYEVPESMESAIRRGKPVRKWNRTRKIEWIEKDHPSWRGLSNESDETGFPLSRE